MAAGGGGAWKVAYADFVTAMMAFFLVMWICGQDQQTRESVAHYFNEPFQFFKDPVGASRNPDKSGAIFKGKNNGQVPNSDHVELGRGRESYTPQSSPSPATRSVGDWIHANEKTAGYWRAQAQKAVKAATLSPSTRGNAALLEDKATEILAEQLENELAGNLPRKDGEGLHNDLLRAALAEVNWTELAQDLLRHERLPQ